MILDAPLRIAFFFDNDTTIDCFVNAKISNKRTEGHPFNRDDHFFYFRTLYDELIRIGGQVNMYDYFKERNIQPTHIIFIDIPRKISLLRRVDISRSVKIVLLAESKIIKPWNYISSSFALFDHILSWSETVLKTTPNSTHMPILFGYTDYNLRKHRKNFTVHQKKLCVLISSNKSSTHKLELYSLRKSLVKWFNDNHPDSFDLYGYDWDKRHIRSPRALRILNRVKYFTNAKITPYKCYKGEALSKIKVMSNYKFSVCFENAHSIPGYLTEKIFDSMISGAVPIYYGDPNVSNKIPRRCFIDFREFEGFKDLFSFLNTISDKEYHRFRSAMGDFLSSDEVKVYSGAYFAKNIVGLLLGTSRSSPKKNRK